MTESITRAEEVLAGQDERAHMGCSRCSICERYGCPGDNLACTIRRDWQDRARVPSHVTLALAAAVEALEEAAADEGARQAELAADGGW